jgi:hypothetical protein
MWFGLLTPGEHPCRPVAAPGIATLSCWNDIARVRQDGPVEDVATGLRRTREWMWSRGQEPRDPRCFTCAAPFPVPDVEELVREADERDLEERGPAGAAGPVVDAPSLRDPADLGARWRSVEAPRRALFALVHVADSVEADDQDEEVLLVVPGPRLGLLVPIDALSRLLLIVGPRLTDDDAAPPLRCERCGALAPGHPAGRGAHDAPPRRGRTRRASPPVPRRRGRPAA